MSPSNGTHGSDADASIDCLYSFWPGLTPAPQPCPEACFSLTLKGRLGGQDAMLTIRAQTAEAFQANLQAVRGLLDAPTLPPATVPQGKEWCVVHGVSMQENQKEGRTWYSHKTEQGWCKGKGGGR